MAVSLHMVKLEPVSSTDHNHVGHYYQNVYKQERAIPLRVEWISKEELSLVLLRQYFIVRSMTNLPL